MTVSQGVMSEGVTLLTSLRAGWTTLVPQQRAFIQVALMQPLTVPTFEALAVTLTVLQALGARSPMAKPPEPMAGSLETTFAPSRV